MRLVGIGGDLALEATDGTTTVSLANMSGGVATTLTLPVNPTAPLPAITSWTCYDEYGNPTNLTTTPGSGPVNYAWYGAQQCATRTSGLIHMGARLYNPVTGLFTSRDPIPGGNTTTHTYPQDPINTTDLNGQSSIPWRTIGRGIVNAGKAAGSNDKDNWVDIALTAACFNPVGGAVATVARGVSLANKARKAFTAGKAAAQAVNGIKASRPVTAVAGRVLTRRLATTQRAENGAKYFVRKGVEASKAQGYKTSKPDKSSYMQQSRRHSNLTRGIKGRHDYGDIHINHK